MDSIDSDEEKVKADALIDELYHDDFARYKLSYSRITNDLNGMTMYRHLDAAGGTKLALELNEKHKPLAMRLEDNNGRFLKT